ncbi:MAG: extracellular solute-binding protein [Deltaproteobacteria bacterium]|nr:extracellular solute-binding protein [Deltaproteobacteria bacterium]
MLYGFLRIVIVPAIWLWVTVLPGAAAQPGPGLLKAKQSAEAKGYRFLTSRDEIIARAKKEGQLRVLYGVYPATYKGFAETFVKKYPFITIQRAEEITGSDASQRFVQELQAGIAGEKWDAIYLSGPFYNNYLSHLAKFDIAGMAAEGVLQIPSQMIDPDNRDIVAAGSALDVIAYNPRLLRRDLIPRTWENLLRPELKGKKFVMDIDPAAVAALTPAWGLEKVLDFARKVREQEPIWGRGHSRMLASLAAGEYALHGGTNYNSVMRLKMKNPKADVEPVLAEPVPARLHEATGILAGAKNPHVALLWIEHMTTPEAQKFLDEVEPYKSSIFAPGSILKKDVEGKKVSVAAWRFFVERGEIEKQIVRAYGFPSTERK